MFPLFTCYPQTNKFALMEKFCLYLLRSQCLALFLIRTWIFSHLSNFIKMKSHRISHWEMKSHNIMKSVEWFFLTRKKNLQNFIANSFARFLSTLIGSAVNYCFIGTAILWSAFTFTLRGYLDSFTSLLWVNNSDELISAWNKTMNER